MAVIILKLPYNLDWELIKLCFLGLTEVHNFFGPGVAVYYFLVYSRAIDKIMIRIRKSSIKNVIVFI